MPKCLMLEYFCIIHEDNRLSIAKQGDGEELISSFMDRRFVWQVIDCAMVLYDCLNNTVSPVEDHRWGYLKRLILG